VGWILVTALVLVAEFAVIVGLGRGATRSYEEGRERIEG
jgi:hypothetical protein